MRKINKKELAAFAGLIAVFVFSSYFSLKYSKELKELVYLQGIWGMLAYVALEVASIVILPLTTLPLLPVAVVFWGSLVAGILSVTGWMIGGFLAFKIARRYGKPVVSKLVNHDRIERIEKMIPTEHVFWVIVFLRMSLPVDILSYVLGLFGNISLRTYILATFIGIVPFAFIYSYSVNLPTWYQIITMGFSLGVVFLGYNRGRSKYKN
ncbi:MAG: VTT domain-containing protein [Candidatus Pacebacteria bacterium]|nr:VTT domain-containing protein [Candidatus Paceibacterota bacterium]NUQ57359.1 TVP38/TMEM64 family protein [Candidatus Paceibacter sp.]